MKKSFLLLALIFIMNIAVFNVGAVSPEDRTTKTQIVEIEPLSNGCYYETLITIESKRNSDSQTKSASTITASKKKNYKDSNGNVLWYVKVTGKFSYNGSASVCTSCSKSAVSNSNSWSIISSSVSKSGNSATTKATARYTTASSSRDYSMSVTITCSANGTIS